MHIRCFDAAKDVNIPTPNIHFPRTPYASPLPAVTSTLGLGLGFGSGFGSGSGSGSGLRYKF